MAGWKRAVVSFAVRAVRQELSIGPVRLFDDLELPPPRASDAHALSRAAAVSALISSSSVGQARSADLKLAGPSMASACGIPWPPCCFSYPARRPPQDSPQRTLAHRRLVLDSVHPRFPSLVSCSLINSAAPDPWQARKPNPPAHPPTPAMPQTTSRNPLP